MESTGVQFVLHAPMLISTADPIIWSHSFAIPAYLVLCSAVVLITSAFLSLWPIKHVQAPHSHAAEHSPWTDPTHNSSSTATGFFYRVNTRVKALGGCTIFLFRTARLLSVLALLSLSLHNVNSRTDWQSGHDTPLEDANLVLCLTYIYDVLLAVLSVTAPVKGAAAASRHLTVILLATFAVYAYRDLWPLLTVRSIPADGSEGSLLWVKVALLGFAAIALPLIAPRQYRPYDLKEPSSTSHPEQTASILSLLTFSFLDPLIWLANGKHQLSFDDFPPLADYDRAKNLVEMSFKRLDVFSGGPKRHLFFGLMKIFGRVYISMAIMVLLKVIADFVAPLAINNLLVYLEMSDGGGPVRPWVWVSALLFGPFIGTIAQQRYYALATAMLVRTEGIVTQLIFEHALRIRMKAETSSSIEAKDNAGSGGATPDTASTITLPVHHEAGEDTSDGGSSSGQSSNNKGKKKEGPKDSETSKDAAGKESNLVGKINNLVTSDLTNLTDGRDFLFIVLQLPFQVGLAIWFLYTILGWSAFVGLAAMILMAPLPALIAGKIHTAQQEAMKKTDARVQTVTETMGVLRMIKLFGWEPKIDELVAEKRAEELIFVRRRQILILINFVMQYSIPVVTMIVTFVTYTGIMKRTLRASTVFSAMAVFDLLRRQLHSAFYVISLTVPAKVSLDRVTEFLQKTELLDSFTGKDEGFAAIGQSEAAIPNSDVIGFKNASFTWSREDAEAGTSTLSKRRFVLHVDDELVFKRGHINLILGATGSGKTSLLMALLGEMHFVPLGPGSWYNLPRSGGIAYAAQESWVQNETIRDNILFNSPYDEERYEKVVYQCGLKRDFGLFEAGDKTEVGEKGLTLSGGQKGRVTLARAIYSSAEILLLDDVLAALDVHTARWIVDKCFKGDLVCGRTLLLVTHNIALASPIADYVVSLGLDGRIASRGSVSDALAKDKTLSAELEHEIEVLKNDEKEIDSERPDAETKQADGKLIVAEEIAEGKVSREAFQMYFSRIGGSHSAVTWAIFLASLALSLGAFAFQTWFLGYWAKQYDQVDDPSQVHITFYVTVYTLLLVFATAFYGGGYAVFLAGELKAGSAIHQMLVRSILGTTLRWLDTTPTSRVIARCTQDIRALDGPLANALNALVDISVAATIRFATVIIVTPAFTIPGAIITALGGWCGQLYVGTQIAVKREMSNAKAPVLANFGAAIAGITSIRAYGAQAMFRQESHERIDRYTRIARTYWDLNRWIAIRVDTLSGAFVAGLAAYLIYGPGHEQAVPSDTGFSITMAVAFSGMIIWFVKLYNDFEVQGNSLERIQAYVNIEQEPKATESGVPPAYWPASGDLKVEHLSARYSGDGPKVLHDLSFHIKSGEHVGVVGRTGSGKSSLTLSLLRCILIEGNVYYDGISTNDLNLDALRSNITIIPQMPELLSGTLRENLDLFHEYDDATLNVALRASGLFSLHANGGSNRVTLDSAISSGGGNLSVGQRQVLALARAIVRGSKLLILDEATSSIDYETDKIIQSSLRRELKGDVTLITVAHRLQTIMDADKIMVLDAGRIIEFDKPSELLKNEHGQFRSLVDGSGDKEALYAMAAGHA